MGLVQGQGQGWLQAAELGLAFLLSALIGVEREIRQKSAGLRTHTLVGVASALIMLISKYGFMDVLAANRVVVDPSRVAAQIVSGIGFIGGGLIFVHRSSVRGLTTAATIWLTASVGMACGAGLPVLGFIATAGHFIVVFLFPPIVRRLPRSRWAPSSLAVSYDNRPDVLSDVLMTCTKRDFAVSGLRFDRAAEPDPDATTAISTVVLEVQGARSISKLAARLAELEGVVSVQAGDGNVPAD